jgi:hypothetical protein
MRDMDDLTAFLNARLDEVEAAAKAASGTDWGQALTFVTDEGGARVAEAASVRTAIHIARHDPARVLREVTAGRRLIAEFKSHDDAKYPDFDGGYVSGLEDAMMIAAAIWSDHPDYRQEWAP